MNSLIKRFAKLLLLSGERWLLWPIAKYHGPSLIKELTPYDVESFEEKIRLGNEYDGGYVIPSRLLSLIQVAYSYGVANIINFEEDLVGKIDIPVRLYDHSVTQLPTKHKNFFFRKQGIASTNHGDFDTFSNQVRENGDVGKRILLKMDIEGDEWKVIDDIISTASTYILAIILEIHQLYRYEQMGDYVQKLHNINSAFTLVHVHGNNCSDIIKIASKTLPNTLELTFINNSLVSKKEIMKRSLPSAIDHPNDPKKDDILLNFWKR